MLEMANFVHTTTGGYMTITDDVGEFTFRKELHLGNVHKKYHQVRSGICVDDVQLSGLGTTKVRIYSRGTAELDRVKRDMSTAHKKWAADRAAEGARAAAHAAVAAFQDEPPAAAPSDAPAPAPAAAPAPPRDERSPGMELEPPDEAPPGMEWDGERGVWTSAPAFVPPAPAAGARAAASHVPHT